MQEEHCRALLSLQTSHSNSSPYGIRYACQGYTFVLVGLDNCERMGLPTSFTEVTCTESHAEDPPVMPRLRNARRCVLRPEEVEPPDEDMKNAAMPYNGGATLDCNLVMFTI